MGFKSTADTTTLVAKLTPSGRQKLIANANTLITKFGVGDSDANYNISTILGSGDVPSLSGDLSLANASTSTFTGVNIKSFINVDETLNIYKTVEENSSVISTSTQHLGSTTITGDTMSQFVLDRTNSTNKYNNLLHSFNLPLDSTDATNFTGTTYGNGGFANTALSGLASENILIVEIPNANYGELVDGKTVKLELETTSGATTAFTIYSAFENTGASLQSQDSSLSESSAESANFGTNYVLLFSDQVQRPNSGATTSWATGYGTPKPHKTYNKEQFNLLTDTNNSLIADKAVGIAYLDKGFIVITEPDIVDNFSTSAGTLTSATTLTFDSVSMEVSQQVTCLLNRNEFATSRNVTFGDGDTVRISEIGLYDDTNDLIAIAKPDRHITKQLTQFLSIGVKITI